MKKVLLIAYYWPPSGGPGVQRWLKMTHYLAELGCDITVLTVRPEMASYPHTDERMVEDVHASIKVIQTDAFNPYRVFGKGSEKKGVAANFSIPKRGRLKFWLLSFLRSHLFIPDPRRGWNRWAKREAIKLCKSEDFDAVITTSPPHSTQLIGLHLKRKLGIRWIVDFRDPWTQIFYYNSLGHSQLSRWIDRRYEKSVVTEADHILHVGDTMKEMLSAEHPISQRKSTVIHNGFDERDFMHIVPEVNESTFDIAYTGTLSSMYNFQPLFRAIDACQLRNSNVRFRIAGQVPLEIQHEIQGMCSRVEFVGELPHDQITSVQVNADLLLVILADVDHAGYILSGKVFEYLRAGNRILCLGPKDGDAAAVISKCKAGKTFERDEEAEMEDFILQCIEEKQRGIDFRSDAEVVQEFARESLAKKVWELL